MKEKIIVGIIAMNSKNNIKNEEESIAVSNTSIENVQSSEFNNLLYDNEIDYINIINDYLDNNKDLANIEYNKAVYMLWLLIFCRNPLNAHCNLQFQT